LTVIVDEMAEAHDFSTYARAAVRTRKVLALPVCLALRMAGCDGPGNAGWRFVGKLSDGLGTKFVEVDQGHARNRVTYDAAVADLWSS
jgi:hypothetical protein